MADKAMGESDALATRSAVRRTWGTFKLSLELIPWAVAATLPALGWICLRRFNPAGVAAAGVDLRNNDTVLVDSEVCRNRAGFVARTWCFEVEFAAILDGAAVFVVNPLAVVCIVVDAKGINSKLLALVGVQLCLYLVFKGAFFLNPDYAISSVSPFGSVALFAAPGMLLRLVLPSDSFATRPSVLMSVYALLAAGLAGVYDSVRAQSELLFLCVVWPIVREVGYTMARIAAKPLITNPRGGGAGVRTRREFAWYFVLVVQIFHATLYRMVATSIDSTETFALFVVLSNVSEILLRASVQERDQLGAFLFEKLRVRALVASVMPASVASSVKSGLQPTLEALEDTKTWYARLSLGEMLAEQIGLALVLCNVLVYNGAVLMMPLPAFSELERPFDESIDMQRYLVRALVQLLSEVAVDTACAAIEEFRMQTRLLETWRSLRYRLSTLALATYVASALAHMVFLLGVGARRQTQECLSAELCSCAPPPGSLYGRYCDRLAGHE